MTYFIPRHTAQGGCHYHKVHEFALPRGGTEKDEIDWRG
jgi:hypothetical protein